MNESKVNELKKDFEGLNYDQKKLLAYRKIIELSNKGIPLKKSFKSE